MAMQYLFPPTTQFQARTGANLTAGFLRVYYTQTDDRAPTYSDFGGTVNEDDIVLDNDGRAVVIVDDTKTYRLEVYTYNGALLFTVDPLSAVGGGGGSSNIVKIISSDGTVKIQAVSGGGITYYDLSTALTPNASKWGNVLGTVSGLDGTNDWEEIIPTVTIGTSAYDYGWTASKDTGYDIAASVEMPAGVAGALYGIEVKCEIQVDGVTVQTEYGYIDPSESMGRVSFEWKGQLSDNQKVDCKLYAKCAQALSVNLAARALFNEECDGIVGNGGGGGGATYEAGQYIDINTANVISVTGVQPASAMIFYAPNSALSSKQDTLIFNYNGPNISGINGSAIDAGAFNFSAGEYIDISGNVISVTGLQPVSGMSAYVEQSAFDDCCSAMSGAVSSLQVDVSAISSVVSGITGATGNYVEKSSISAESATWNEVSAKLDESASSLFQPSGDYAYNSSVSSKVEQSAFDQCCSAMSATVSALETGKLDNSASSTWYPMTGNPSGFLTEHQELSGYVEKSSISAESANWNEVSAKQDSSAMSAYVPFSAVESTTASAITSIGGSAIKGHEYTGISPVVVDNVNDEISVQHSSLTVNSSMTAYESAGQIVLGVNQSALNLSSYVAKSSISSESATWDTVTAKLDTSAFSSVSGTFLTAHQSLAGYATESYVDSSVSGKLDATASSQFLTSLPADLAYTSDVASAVSGKMDLSASSSFYPMTGNPSGFLTAHQSLAGYATEQYVDSSVSSKLDSSAYDSAWFAPASGMSAYAYESSLSSKLDASASSDFYSTANPSGFITGVDLSDYATTSYVDSSVSGKLDTTAFNPGDFYSTSNPSGFITGVDLSNYATTGYVDSSVSSKLDASASSDFYSTSNPSGFITGVDLSNYATTSYVDSSVSSKLDATASSDFYSTSNPSGFITGVDLSDYQPVSGMTAYQLSGEYYSASNPSGFITGVDLSDYATTAYVDSSVSGKLDASASSDFYSTSNPSGFITGVDLSNYATTGYVDSSVSGKQDVSGMTAYQETSGMSAYQLTADMTAYQPSGDYIYASALGTGVI